MKTRGKEVLGIRKHTEQFSQSTNFSSSTNELLLLKGSLWSAGGPLSLSTPNTVQLYSPYSESVGVFVLVPSLRSHFISSLDIVEYFAFVLLLDLWVKKLPAAHEVLG